MTKNAFLKKLSEDVAILSEAEQQDIINEYKQHLEMKIASGMSEEEATADFEPYDEFISELLSAYHINPNYQGEDNSTLGNFFRRGGLFLQRCLDVLLSLNGKELGYVLSRSFLLLIVTLGIALVPKIIFGISFSFMLPYAMHNLLSGVGNFLYGIFVFAMVCYAIYYGLSRYLLPLRQDDIPSEGDVYDGMEKESHLYAGASTTFQRKNHTAESHPSPDIQRGHRSDRGRPKENFLGPIFMLLLKLCFLFAFFLPLLILDLFLVIATGASIAGVFMGYPLIGITFIGLGTSLLGILLFIAVWRVTFMEA